MLRHLQSRQLGDDKLACMTLELSTEQALSTPTTARHVNVGLLLAFPIPVSPYKESCAATTLRVGGDTEHALERR